MPRGTTRQATTSAVGGTPAKAIPMPQENIYGHLARVQWMRRFLKQSDRVVEVGCGTGYRITLPLLSWGYDVVGVDTDEESIARGKELLRQTGFDDVLSAHGLDEVSGEFDVVIVSEVLEHLVDSGIEALLATARSKLRPGGFLLVTVPNGYGWFELESFLWNKLGVGRVLTRSGIAFAIRRLKGLVVRGAPYSVFPSSLFGGPHVQRFTLRSICDRITRSGFVVQERTGSALFSGPFSDMLFTGAESVMRLDRFLGRRLPPIASGFYVAARKP
jgi:SAM-dependent methyltransferase